MEWPGKFKDLRFRWLKVKNPKNKLYRMNWLVTSKKKEENQQDIRFCSR